MRGFIAVQDLNDPCVWEAASAPWEVLAKPLNRGPFRNIKEVLGTRNWLLYWESFAGAVHVQGLTPADMLALTVPMRLGGRTAYWGAPLHERGMVATLPGAVDALVDAGQQHLIVFVRLDWLTAKLDPETLIALTRCAERRVLPASNQRLTALGRWLSALLARLHAEPLALDHAAAVAALEHDLLAALMRTLFLSVPTAPLADARRRRCAFDHAIDWLRKADVATLSAPDLAAVTGVSQRTLEYAFRDELGTSPVRFIRRLRLHRVRRGLLAADPKADTVAEVAMSFGFYQLGRFAAEYRAVFGELPSATLARHCTVRDHALLGLG